MAVVEDLYIYPLKSARGIPMPSVRLGASGFEWDRHWMAVNDSGLFMSQRTHPRLARVVPVFEANALVLNAPELPPLRLPLEPTGEVVSVRVWDDRCTGLEQGMQAAEWISTALGVKARLVRRGPQSDRLANAKYAGPYPVPLAYPDGFPLLVVNRASLEGLNRRMPQALPMERFRPNVVLGGLPEFAEDDIEMLRIGDIQLQLVKPCTRCVITSTDQQTGELSTNPLPVLRTFRFDRQLRGVKFGENAVISAGIGSLLQRGTPCEPIARVASRP